MRQFLIGMIGGAALMYALGLIDKTAATSLKNKITSKFK